MRKLAVVLAASFLIGWTILIAQDRPVLNARQLEASRALAEFTRPPTPSKLPNILIRPTDRSIYIDLAGVVLNPGHDRPPSASDQIKDAACSADVVLAGTVEDMAGFLNEDAQFILTEYVIRVDAILRGALGEKTRISYVRPGGSTAVEGRVVTARHNLYPALERSVKYVFFLKRIGSGELFKPAKSTTFDVLVGGERTLRALGPLAEQQLTSGIPATSVRDQITAARCGQ